MNRLDFHGRHAVITGGATGLGYAIAERLLASGGDVTLWDRDLAAAEAAARKLGDNAVAVEVDVSDPAAVAQAVQTTLQRRGAATTVDALVNCAGITGPNTKLAD